MSKQNELLSNLRRIYKDILLGYTKCDNDVYFKHFREIDIGHLNEIKSIAQKKAQEKGLPTEEEKVKILIDQGIWDKEKEQQRGVIKAQILNQFQTRTKLIIKAQRDQVDKRIKKLEKDLAEINKKRLEIVGLTAERYADKISSEQVIRISIFKDEKLSEYVYSEEEYDYLEPVELNELVRQYDEFVSHFNEDNLQRVAASAFFMNPFFLSKEDPVKFFGKPIIYLTNYQTELFSLGLKYKSTIEKKGSPPIDLQSNIDDLVKWYEVSTSAQKAEAAAGGPMKDGATVMGASKTELEAMKAGENTVDLIKLAKQKGGELSMKDFIDIHVD